MRSFDFFSATLAGLLTCGVAWFMSRRFGYRLVVRLERVDDESAKPAGDRAASGD